MAAHLSRILTILLFSLLLVFTESLTISFCSPQNTGDQNGASSLLSKSLSKLLTANQLFPQISGSFNPTGTVKIHANPNTHTVSSRGRIVSAQTMHHTNKWIPADAIRIVLDFRAKIVEIKLKHYSDTISLIQIHQVHWAHQQHQYQHRYVHSLFLLRIAQWISTSLYYITLYIVSSRIKVTVLTLRNFSY